MEKAQARLIASDCHHVALNKVSTHLKSINCFPRNEHYRVFVNNSRPINIRRTSDVPAPIS